MAETSQIHIQVTRCQPPLWQWELSRVKAFYKAQTAVVWPASQCQVLQIQSIIMSQVMTSNFRTQMSKGVIYCYKEHPREQQH